MRLYRLYGGTLYWGCRQAVVRTDELKQGLEWYTEVALSVVSRCREVVDSNAHLSDRCRPYVNRNLLGRQSVQIRNIGRSGSPTLNLNTTDS